jgi:hypothetical protein
MKAIVHLSELITHRIEVEVDPHDIGPDGELTDDATPDVIAKAMDQRSDKTFADCKSVECDSIEIEP